MSASRVGRSVAMSVREYARTPVLLALLVFLPAYFVGAFSTITPSSPITIEVTGTTLETGVDLLVGALMAPLASALTGGIVGLFLIRNARRADGRLVVCGYRPTELVVSRVGLLAASGLLVTGISVGMLLVNFTPEFPVVFAALVFVAAVTYGMFGVIVGMLVDTLPGVYVMLFAPIVDILLFQNPVATESLAWAKLLPGHYVTVATMDAAFTSGTDVGVVGMVLVYLAVLVVIGCLIFLSQTGRR